MSAKSITAAPFADGNLPTHVRARRCELELSQEELAARAGTSTALISQLERGKRLPTVGVLERILGALGEELAIKKRLSPTS
jgi:transcriptional regulator with XRE-family HTH domain